jgi:hypothetical protein
VFVQFKSTGVLDACVRSLNGLMRLGNVSMGDGIKLGRNLHHNNLTGKMILFAGW